MDITKLFALTLICVPLALGASCNDSAGDPDSDGGGGKADDYDDDDDGDDDGDDDDDDGGDDEAPCALSTGDETLTVVTVGQWEPWNFVGPDGALTGWDVDYLDRIMELIGRDHVLQTRDWGDGCCATDPDDPAVSFPPDGSSELFSAVHTGAVDMAISVISDSDRRVAHFVTSTRYGFLPSFVEFSVLADNAAQFELEGERWWEALHGKTLVVSNPGTNQDYYLSLLVAETVVQIEVLYAVDLAQEGEEPGDAMVQAVRDGVADAIFGEPLSDDLRDFAVAGSLLELDQDRFDRVWGTGAAVYMPPDVELYQPGLAASINCAINHIAANEPDFYAQLKAEYGKGLCNPLMTTEQCEAF